jgi:large conductance mechanosensitive channel
LAVWCEAGARRRGLVAERRGSRVLSVERVEAMLLPPAKADPEEWNMLQDFKNFALRGNVVDLAVGVIIGAAFGKIVDSLVNDVIMPVIGAVTGGLDFSNYFIPLSKAAHTDMAYEEAKKVGAAVGYGQFITVAVNFLIIAFVLFLIIQAFERLKRKAPEAPAVAEPNKTETLLTEIRDAIRGYQQ